MAIVNDKAVCYWASCHDNQMTISSDNSIYRYEADKNITQVKSGLNYILAIAGASVNGKENISFSMDADGNTTTTNDITVYTLEDNNLICFDKGNNDVAYTNVFYGKLDGIQTLFTTDMKNIYYIQDGETKSVLERYDTLSGNFNFVVKNGVPTLFWTKNEKTGNAVYSSFYENGSWTTPVKVSETGTLLSNVDIVVYNDEFRGICLSSTIEFNELKGANEIAGTDICALKIDEVHDISIDGIYINEQNIRIGKQTEFNIYVTNNGTKKVNNVTFTISDSLGSEVTITKPVNLTSGSGCFVCLPYTAPENYTKTNLNVTISCDEINDNNSENDAFSKEIGKAKLILTESEIIEVNGKYLINAMVTNVSDVSVKNVVINTLFNDSEEVVESTTISEIGPQETYLIQNIIYEDNIVFDEKNNVARIYMDVEKNDNCTTGAKICYIITKPANDECEHSLTRFINRIEPTCNNIGYEGDIQCTYCEKIIGNGTSIPMTDHIPSEWIIVTAAQLGVDGLEQLKCAVCNEILDHKVIPALTTKYLPGDANNDGKISAADARIILRISAKLEKLENYNLPFELFDVNGDGKITASDARKVLRISAKLE